MIPAMRANRFLGWFNGPELAHAIKSVQTGVRASCGTNLPVIVNPQEERTKPACSKCLAWWKKNRYA